MHFLYLIPFSLEWVLDEGGTITTDVVRSGAIIDAAAHACKHLVLIAPSFCSHVPQMFAFFAVSFQFKTDELLSRFNITS
jgi:hypothetical protein